MQRRNHRFNKGGVIMSAQSIFYELDSLLHEVYKTRYQLEVEDTEEAAKAWGAARYRMECTLENIKEEYPEIYNHYNSMFD